MRAALRATNTRPALSWAWNDSAFADPAQALFFDHIDEDNAARIVFQQNVLDASCAAAEADSDDCMDPGLVTVNHLTTPFFVMQDQTDPVIDDFTPDLRSGVRDVLPVLGQGYGPDAGEHGWLEFSRAYQRRIDGVSALDAFANWLFGRGGDVLVIED